MGGATDIVKELYPPITPAAGWVLAALALPHILYFFVWTQTPAFIRLAKVTGIPAFNLFYQLSVVLKFVQLGALVAWGFSVSAPADAGLALDPWPSSQDMMIEGIILPVIHIKQVLPPFVFTKVTVLRYVVGLGLVAAGQTLNAGVFKALGKEGTYYGVKLGKRVEWYEGFPFTVVRDPQYVGCVLTIWGLVTVFFSPAYVQAGLVTVATGWSIFYLLTGLIENYM